MAPKMIGRLPDVGNAFGNSLERGAAGARPLACANPEIPHRDDRINVEGHAEHVVHVRPELVEDPADRRPGDRGRPIRGRVPGDRLGKAIERHEEGKKRLNRGLGHAQRDAQENDGGVVRPHLGHAHQREREQEK